MRSQIRIVSGSLRGRKLTVEVNANLRPTPQRVREALFSILGNAVPDRPFFDVFAGTGVVGLEALSRGARQVTFVERDFRLIAELEGNLRRFGVERSTSITRTDVYRWMERWRAPAEPATVFLSPPFADFTRRADDLLQLVTVLQERLHPGSVLVLQAEQAPALEALAARSQWDERRYGRNHLLIWVKETDTGEEPAAPEATPKEPGADQESHDGT